MCVNNIAYADDLVLICPDARSMNVLLDICSKFAMRHFITYSVVKTVAMIIKPCGMQGFFAPKLFIGANEIKYVHEFKYLGHIVTSDFKDERDIDRETRNLYIRGNTIIRKFHFMSLEVKLALFKAYCYPLYTCSLWSNYRQCDIGKLRVAYNNILRKLIGVPQWQSARTLFVNLGVRSFNETVRTTSYSLLQRILQCNNSVVRAVLHSDCFVQSATRLTWCSNLLTDRNSSWYGLLG